ncbi:MAG TPA: CAP domain-containing protein [Burkholderiaceae bacterium]|nr:CAP domain-containing protein [Burkholderiaceae bacterium]
MMQIQKNHALQVLTLCAALTLSACGGGGSSSATTNNTGTSDTPAAGGTSGTGGTGGTSGTTSTGGTTPSGGGGTPATTATADECPIGDYKSAVVATINSIRSSAQVCGGVVYPAVGALSWNSQLDAAAARHSNDMAVNNWWNDPYPHLGTDGTTIRERAPAAGYSYRSVGENVAAGQTSVNDVFYNGGGYGWMTSPSHCANIMTASFVDVGAACKYNPSSTYQYYWTLVMGNR